MRRVFSSPNIAQVNHLASVLESVGIACRVQGEHLSAAVGELPPIECWADLFILDDGRFDDAEKILAQAAATGGKPWDCGCGETLDAAFGECWRCGQVRADLVIAARTSPDEIAS